MRESEYKFKADLYAPALKPKSNPKDKDRIQAIYGIIEDRLRGIEKDLKACSVEKLVIDITKRGGVADEDSNGEN